MQWWYCSYDNSPGTKIQKTLSWLPIRSWNPFLCSRWNKLNATRAFSLLSGYMSYFGLLGLSLFSSIPGLLGLRHNSSTFLLLGSIEFIQCIFIFGSMKAKRDHWFFHKGICIQLRRLAKVSIWLLRGPANLWAVRINKAFIMQRADHQH